MIDAYTRILEVAAESEEEKVRETAVAKLVAHLKSEGRVKMLGDIAKELRKIAARRKALAPVVEIAHERDFAAAKKAAEELGAKAAAHINPTLIKGYRVRANGKLVDRSAKRGLIDIYQNVTK